MKKWLLMVMIVMAGGWVMPAQTPGDFTKTMTPEEAAATGLGKLTPDELARLKAIVERYKVGEVAAVQVQAEAKVTAVAREAEQKVAAAQEKIVAAEAKARAAETKATAAASTEGKKSPGWLKALITLKKTEEKPEEAEALESRLAETFTSFSGKRRFTLENGQVWQMIEPEEYSGPAMDRPPVVIKPGVFGTYWLRVVGSGTRFKVKPVKLE